MRPLAHALLGVTLLMLGVAPLSGCRFARLGVAVAEVAAHGVDLRSQTREEAAANLDCSSDAVELEWIADGYVAKGCGRFQHFKCSGPIDVASAWQSCVAEPPMKIYPPLHVDECASMWSCSAASR